MEKLTSILMCAAILMSASCGKSSDATGKNTGNTDSIAPTAVRLGTFNADSAYKYIEEQVAFGPRVPGTAEHEACRDHLVESFRRLGADSVVVQNASVTAYNGDKLPISNIIAGFNTSSPRRILLAAHWDTRPWADKANNHEDRMRPVLGANDGASGVGVLLEIARNLAINKPEIGVDMILFDAEDYGQSDSFSGADETWCLGSQYWADHMMPYSIHNKPVFGILLDMVGGRNARFHYDVFSQANAQLPTVKVWSEAERLGLSHIFIREIGGAIIDDHINMTKAGIPTTNIVELQNVETQSFPPYWHTLNDDMSNIDRTTLDAVGSTVLNVIYKERSNSTPAK